MTKKEALNNMVDSLVTLESAWVAFRDAQHKARQATEQFCKVMENSYLNFEYLEADGEI